VTLVSFRGVYGALRGLRDHPWSRAPTASHAMAQGPPLTREPPWFLRAGATGRPGPARRHAQHPRTQIRLSSFGGRPIFDVQSANASVASSRTTSAACKLNPGIRYTPTCPSCFVWLADPYLARSAHLLCRHAEPIKKVRKALVPSVPAQPVRRQPDDHHDRGGDARRARTVRAEGLLRPESASSGATRLVKWGWVPC